METTMRSTLAIVTCCLLLSPAALAGEYIFPDGMPASLQGGLMIFRRGDQTIWSLGGGLLPRRVRVTEATPEGPIVTQFTLPSNFHAPTPLPWSECAPAFIQVEIPDANGIIYVEEQLVRTSGTSRLLPTPPLPPGRDYSLRLRAAFKVGDNLLIEDKQILIRAGQQTAVTFDGTRAISVPLVSGE
jgi:uncharacterized protein (TIGR03000 family)